MENPNNIEIFKIQKMETIDDAKAYICALIGAGYVFHFEDDVFTITWSNRTPTNDELESLSKNRDMFYTFNWGDDCPIGYALKMGAF